MLLEKMTIGSRENTVKIFTPHSTAAGYAAVGNSVTGRLFYFQWVLVRWFFFRDRVRLTDCYVQKCF